MVRREMTVRKAETADAPAIAAVAENCFSRPLGQEDFRESCDNPDKCLLVCGEMPCGYVLMTLLGVEAEVYSIAVSPEYRGQGLGRALLGEGLRQAKLAGAERVFLEVRAGNEPALGLYAALGFEKLGVRKGYYSAPKEDAVIMAADI